MADKQRQDLTRVETRDDAGQWTVPQPSLPALPGSAGAIWGSRTTLLKKDTAYVQGHVAYLQARTAQSDAMRGLVESRMMLGASIARLAALPEYCASEYLRGRRQRANELYLTQLRCEEAELNAKASVVAARQRLAALDPTAVEEPVKETGLSPQEVDELVGTLPDISEDARETLLLLLKGRIKEKGA